MRYRYAVDDHDVVTDALTLDRATYVRGRTLRCAGCNSEVIPVLGAFKERHFRHKHVGEQKCSRETYLHELAKTVVANSFEAAVAAGQPYWLTMVVPQVCRRWEAEFGLTCEQGRGKRTFDLTRYFDSAAVEAPIDGFVADVLLSSSRTGEQLLIEIDVTHQCTPEKIAAGTRIIEIGVESDEQVEWIRDGIDTRKGWVRLYNFKRQPPKEVACARACRLEIASFHVFESGKSFIKVGHPREIAAIKRSRKTVHSHVIDKAPHGILAPYLAASGYQEEAAKALRAGAPIKCCTFCRYAGFHTLEKPVFCKVRRREVGVNAAATCATYRPSRHRR